MQPLPLTHPQYTVNRDNGFTEYKVENWRLARDGSGRTLRGTSLFAWTDIVFGSVLVLLYRSSICLGSFFAVFWTYQKCSQVIHESIIVMPGLGIQLETHRGLPKRPLYASRAFIPQSSLHNLVINEGFQTWDVRYYLVAIAGKPQDETILSVAYPNILPHFPILLNIYRDIHKHISLYS